MHPSTAWTSPGGDFSGGFSASAVVIGVGFYTWSTAQMAADVQGWLDSPTTNDGWFIIGLEPPTSNSSKRFNTRENPTGTLRPALTLDFTPPVILGGCCLPGDTCQVILSTNCSAMGGTFQGASETCMPNPCDDGACCAVDGNCSETEDETTCTTGGGSFQGVGTTCGGSSCPLNLEPFVDALPIPAVAQPVTGSPGGAATYEIAMRQVTQQLHRDLPPSTVWGYGDGPSGATYPGPTIEATANEQVTVTWINDITDDMGQPLQHYFTVDTCPHGANDQSARTVVHLHGAHAPAEFDGYPEDTFLPGAQDVYIYPNNQLPATLWYHDHALGITRLNVYLGLAGFYLVRDAFEQSLDLPSGEFEIPMLIQDKAINADGSLEYPEQWVDHFVGDQIVVNGKVWPYLDVKQGKYRFRILNGSGSRTLTLGLSESGMQFQQIGTDGGLLPDTVSLDEITLGPAERADVVLDFASFAPGTEIIMTNSAPAPFPGTPGVGVVPNVMKFIVQAGSGDTTPLPVTLRALNRIAEADAIQERDFVLRIGTDACTGTSWLINGLTWDDITEYPELGTTEIWSFINRSAMTHPMHMHLVMFQTLDRQPFQVVGEDIVTTGPPEPPAANEDGWKDTIRVPPNTITRVIAHFTDYTGKFAYHCHILEHEDHEMMRQFWAVGAVPLTVSKTLLSWGAIPGASAYDVLRGDLILLHDSAGDFSLSTEVCLINNQTATSWGIPANPGPGEGHWFLIRKLEGSMNGTYDSGTSSQIGSRDDGIDASGNDCPR